MAVSKATTTKDLTSEDLTAQAVDPQPTRDQLVDRIVEHSDPDMVADVKAPKTVKVTSPAGTTTEVPEGLVEVLQASGYSKSK